MEVTKHPAAGDSAPTPAPAASAAPAANLSPTGLTSAEVAQRVAAGQSNAAAGVRTKSIPVIVRNNICTLFNIVNIVLAVAIFWTGSYRNLLFMVVILCNIGIGIYQEIRSKLTIDRLSVITATKAHVMRDGVECDLPLEQIVLDDVVRLGRGDQVPSDCTVLDGSCSANESLLTGESDLVAKQPGDTLFSGSFIAAGSCVARVTAVGDQNYATRINNEAKAHRQVRSGIMDALKTIIKVATILIVPMGVLLIGKELLAAGTITHEVITSAILHASAALVGMIPQGLILLTSAVLAVSVMRLAQHKVLVQELYCVETLARVDVICLDKTGTITTGEMDMDELVPLDGVSYFEALRALVALDAVVDPATTNETARAIHDYLAHVEERPDAPKPVQGEPRIVPFSSEHKYSGVCYGSQAGNFCMGAAEFVLKGHPDLPQVQDTIARLAGTRRVIVVAAVDDFDEKDAIRGGVRPLGLVFIKDRVRENAPKTLAYFTEQGVQVNVISGDSVATVSNIAASVGVPHADKSVDMTTVHTDEELRAAARDCRVFCRVSPEQKKKLVVALQEQGHTVAMTGDGVNDVLALHTADCSIAMGSGSDAARSVANLILMDNDFASMPHVVAEGRRSINNLQRSGALFLVKTMFSIFLAAAFVAITAYAYPFVTIQLSLIDLFAVGIPSFVLALEPNKERVRGDFLRNTLTKALPGAIMVVSASLASCLFAYCNGLSQEQFSTLCVILTCVAGINLVVRLSLPLNPIRVLMLIVVVAGPLVGILLLPSVFMLSAITGPMAMMIVIATAVITVLYQLLFSYAQRREDAYLASLEGDAAGAAKAATGSAGAK